MANGPRANATHEYVDKNNVTLREYLEALIHNVESRMEDKLIANDKALMIATDNANRRLEGMNEFRQSLSDQAETFITKTEYRIQTQQICGDIERLESTIKSLELSRAELSGKANQSQVTQVLAISIISIVIGIVSIVMRLLGQ